MFESGPQGSKTQDEAGADVPGATGGETGATGATGGNEGPKEGRMVGDFVTGAAVGTDVDGACDGCGVWPSSVG